MEKVIIIGSGIPSHLELLEMLKKNNHQIEIVVYQKTECPFDKEPLKLIPVPILPKVQILYDKKGKPLELPKSKFHK